MSVRGNAIFIACIGLLVAVPVAAQPLSLLNADFEFDTPVASPPSQWEISAGTYYVTSGSGLSPIDPTSAFSGSSFITANRLAPNPDDTFPATQMMNIFQTVDVSQFAAAIDMGGHAVQLGFAYNDNDAGDNGIVSLSFLDGSSSPLGGGTFFQTDSQPTGSGQWATASLIGSVPTGTRYVHVSLAAESVGSGTARNISYDALSAELLDSIPPAPSRDVVHGNLIQFVDNGAWSWFQDERAMVDQQHGNLIVGSIANQSGVGGGAVDGHVRTTHFNLATGSRTTFTHNDLESYGAGDDHNVPALLQKTDGNVLAFYAAHNNLSGTEDDRSYYRTFDTTAEAWGAESEYHWWDAIPDNAPGAGGTTYSNVFQLSAEDPDGDGHGRLYNIARTQQSPHIMFSDDNGATWQYGGQLTKQASNPPSNSYVNGYYKYTSNGTDRIDFIATEFHPRDFNNSIYHAYIEDGKLYDSAGNELDDDIFDAADTFDADAVRSTDDFTQIFQAGTDANSRAWTTDIQSYDDGTITALFKARAGGFGSHATGANDHRVWFARFNPTTQEWSTNEIARAGGQLFSGSETDYTGLGALHPDDPDTIYISTEIDPATDEPLAHHEIFRGVTNDGGTTWAWSAVTENSSYDNLRPIVPSWDEQNTAVLWWRGSMSASQNYDAAVVGILDRRNDQSSLITYVDATLGNTTLADGSPFTPTAATAAPGATDGNWHQRTGVGNGSDAFTADETGSENAPTLRTSVDDLNPGTYDIFAFFWSDINQDWQIEAGLAEDDLMLFRIRGSQQAEARHFGLTPVLDEENRALYRGYLGRVELTGDAPLDVFVDDSTGSGTASVWYDGIGYARVLAIDLAGDYNNDGLVNAADYVVWRNNEGTDNLLPNDPIGGTIGNDQYELWFENFGSIATDGEPSLAHVPEPVTGLLLACGLISSLRCRTAKPFHGGSCP